MSDQAIWRQTPQGVWQYQASDGNWYDGQRVAPPSSGPNAETNGLAIASLVFGILWLGWLGSILAVIFAFVALRQIRERRQAGRGLAIAGMVLGWIGVATGILFIILAVAVSNSITQGGLKSGTTTISVTGDESAQTLVTVDVDGQEQQHTGTLPYSQTITGRPFTVVVSAQVQDSNDNATVSCDITATGQPPVTNSSSGAFTIVTCSATPGA